MVETEETIRPEMRGLLDPDIDCYLLIHNDVERLDSLALALENENKKVRLARDFEELKQMRFLNHQLQQIAVKILK
jgi:predicted RNase H-like nuclease (RuvC/YqgF family)